VGLFNYYRNRVFSERVALEYDVGGLIISLFFFLVAIGSTFFTPRFLWVMFKIVEFFSAIQGEANKEYFRKKYDPLGTDPMAYAKSHPMEILIGRIIGIAGLLFYVFYLISLLIH